MGRLKIKRGAGKQRVDGKTFRLADEVRYIQRRAAQHDARIISAGPLLLFSTETGDAWLLDPSDQLAAPIACDGVAVPVHIEDAVAHFSVGWKGRYRIDDESFTYHDTASGRVRTILGYPTRRITQQISNMSG